MASAAEEAGVAFSAGATVNRAVTEYLAKPVARVGMRVVAFVGTFDPIHEGHLETARQCLAAGADEVLFIPKMVSDSKSVATGRRHRINMVLAAIAEEAEDARFNVYTADPSVFLDTSKGDFTLKRLLQHVAELYHTRLVGEVCGSDAFHQYPASLNPQYFYGQDIYIALRPGFETLPEPVPNGRLLQQTPSHSSSQFRANASDPTISLDTLRGQGAPQAVLDYILRHGLYSRLPDGQHESFSSDEGAPVVIAMH
eukprot:TRINITY_DN15594_c0_g1_i1.p1 TRINITY_DN15594_c0_g1~~TRINITY_DN15594_c0_g1_i1.p1  ORF type:complete len:291 (+),score=89.14 TRINITY_DN15594_c0_g1_i1:109-873(+)